MMTTINRTPPRRRQHGAVAVMAAVMMITLIMFLAVVVDTGRIFLEKRSLQKNADLAALETALLYCRDQDASQLESYAAAALGTDRNNFRGGDIAVSLGKVTSGSGNSRTFTPNGLDDSGKAVQVVLTKSNFPASLFQQLWPTSPGTMELSAEAVAQACEPVAQLAIRSSLAKLDSSQSTLLNPLLGGLLGTNLSLSAADWNGILDTNINLLSYLDVLASDLNLDVGDYDGVLDANVSIGDLIDASIIALEKAGDTASVSALNALSAAIPSTPTIKLGEVLNIQTGSEKSALDTTLDLFSIINGSIQLAAGDNVANIDLPVNLPGLATVSVKSQILVPQQLSPIGNPETDEIYVRSAQVRTLVSVDLGETTQVVDSLTNLVTPFLNPVVDFLNTAGYTGLGLIGAVGNLLDAIGNLLGSLICSGASCPESNVAYIDILKQSLQINIDAGGGEIFTSPDQVPSPYLCSGEDKELNAKVNTSLLSIKIGKIEEDDVFSSLGEAAVTSFPLIEVGYKKMRPNSCFLGSCSGERWQQGDGTWQLNAKTTAEKYVLAGLGLSVDTNLVGASNMNHPFISPDLPELGDPCLEENPGCYQSIPAGSRTLGDLDISVVPYSSSESGVLGNLLGGNQSLLSGLVDDLLDSLLSDTGLIAGIVNALIDPATGVPLLDILGADIAGADVGAAMTCENDKVRLVM